MITLSFNVIWIPIVITILSILIPIILPESGGFMDLSKLFYTLFGFAVIGFTWVTYEILIWIFK